jgi:hypothetical protein
MLIMPFSQGVALGYVVPAFQAEDLNPPPGILGIKFVAFTSLQKPKLIAPKHR